MGGQFDERRAARRREKKMVGQEVFGSLRAKATKQLCTLRGKRNIQKKKSRLL